MPKTIDIDRLAAEIAEGLKEYGQEVVEKINVSSESIGKMAVAKLRQTPPTPKRTGEYAKGWTMTTEKEHGQPDKRYIYNKKKPYLTHLLEHGHAKRGGGRVSGKPHIRPAEEEVIQEFAQMVEEMIERG